MLTQIIADDALETIAKRVALLEKKEAVTVASNGVKEEPSDESKTHLRDLIGSKERLKEDKESQDTGEERKHAKIEHKYFVRGMMENNRENSSNYVWGNGAGFPIKSFDEEETKKLYPGNEHFIIYIKICNDKQCQNISEVPHSWLSKGKVLRLNSSEEDDAKSLDLYQDVWKRGQPVVVGMATKHLKTSLWEPSR